jgi:hypothetical protein
MLNKLMMLKDKIVDEVRNSREKLFAEYDYDIHKYALHIYEKQKLQKDKLVSEPFKKEVLEIA